MTNQERKRRNLWMSHGKRRLEDAKRYRMKMLTEEGEMRKFWKLLCFSALADYHSSMRLSRR